LETKKVVQGAVTVGVAVSVTLASVRDRDLKPVIELLGDLPAANLFAVTSASTDTGGYMPSTVIEAFLRLPSPMDVQPIASAFPEWPVVRATKKSM
jgi:hypothetical protein